MKKAQESPAEIRRQITEGIEAERAHRREHPKSRKEKRAEIRKALAKDRGAPDLSDRTLADWFGVSHVTIGKIRKELDRVRPKQARLSRDGKRRRLPIRVEPELAKTFRNCQRHADALIESLATLQRQLTEQAHKPEAAKNLSPEQRAVRREKLREAIKAWIQTMNEAALLVLQRQYAKHAFTSECNKILEATQRVNEAALRCIGE